jgi:hypothetical protein
MVNEIRIYMEGGGNDVHTKKLLRQGFNGFLTDLVAIARSRRIGWQIIPCGPRHQAFGDFLTALETHPDRTQGCHPQYLERCISQNPTRLQGSGTIGSCQSSPCGFPL